MPDLPTGTITFLLTDIQGSTRLWEQHPDAMSAALVRHDALLTVCIERHGGVVIRSRGEGDSFFAVFARATGAVAAACALQRALVAEPWPTPTPLCVRAGINTGEAVLREGDYFGTSINRCARLRAIGHGGQTLLSQATADLVRDDLPAETSLRALGTHRLKDLQRPEQVYQLLHPDLPADFPPLNSLDALPNNLPQQLTSFIGREREIADVKGLLSAAPSGTRLLTLTGAGGCGKTRLALQVAAELVEDYQDGVWLVELAALADPALLPQAVASALGVREEPGRPLPATLVEHLQPRDLMLVLDNCEHLVAACASLVHTLLRACPKLHILATSREVLSLGGETAWRVPSLALPPLAPLRPDRRLPPDTDLVATLTQYEAVHLFVDRALASRPDFTLTPESALAVVQLCHQLDGIPLALELAAARVTVLPIEQITARLDDRFRLLTGGSRTALPRQQTLRALIDWSYDLLSEKERLFWRRLSVFVGGFAMEAAEAVCAGDEIDTDEVLDLLTQLADKSLVLVEEQGEVVRYRLLETIRQYGAERLRGADEERALRERHRDHYLEFAEQAEASLLGAGQREWLERLEAEHANLRAALGWSVERGEAEAGLRLGGALWRFWAVRGYLEEGRARLAELLALPRGEEQHPSRARAKALQGAGALAWNQGDYRAARTLYEESLAIWRELGDRRGIAGSLSNLGSVAKEQSDYETALSLYQESLAIYRELGDRRGIALSLNNMGLVAYYHGDDTAARALYEESLAIKRTLGDEQGIASSLSNLGLVALHQGDYAAARRLYEESLAKRRELGDRWGTAASLRDLGNVAYYQGDDTAARAFYEESLAIEEDLGNKRGVANSLGSLGLLAQRQREYSRAAALYQESLVLYQEVGDRSEIAECLEGLAGVTGARGEHARAARLFGAAAALREAIGVPREPGDRTAYEAHVAEARAGLGAEAFAAAWEQGRAMTLDQAIAEAVDWESGE